MPSWRSDTTFDEGELLIVAKLLAKSYLVISIYH